MNKEYIYLDGKSIVLDEEGNKKVMLYNDKMDDILSLENVVESLEQKQDSINTKITSCYEKYNNLKNTRFLPLIFTIIISFSLPFLCSFLLDSNVFQARFNEVMRLCFFASAIIVTDGALLSLIGHFDYKTIKKEIDGLECQKQEINNIISKKRCILNELNPSKKNDVSDKDYFVKKIDSSDEIQYYDDYLDLYYDYGYNQSKYNKYYYNNKLYNKLRKKYLNDDIDEFSKYIESNTSIKVKKLEKKHFK